VVIHTPPWFDDHVSGVLNLTDVLLLLTRLDFPGLLVCDGRWTAAIGSPIRVSGVGSCWWSPPRTLTFGDRDGEVHRDAVLGADSPFSRRFAGGRGKLPTVPADSNGEVDEPTRQSAAEPPVGEEWQPEDPITTAFASGLRSQGSVIDELGSELDELRDAYVAVDRAVHGAFEAVLAREQGSVSAEDRAAITRTSSTPSCGTARLTRQRSHARRRPAAVNTRR
jgi:hypothetical protein